MLVELFYKILRLSLSGTILFLIVTLLKPITKKFFSPSWNYYLLFITVITFIIPYSIVIPKTNNTLVNVQTFIEQKNSVSTNKEEKETRNISVGNKDNLEAIATIGAAKSDNNSKIIKAVPKTRIDLNYAKERIWIVWILGGLFFIYRQSIGIIGFKRKLRALSRDVKSQEIKNIFYQCSNQLNIHKDLPLMVCEEIGTPMVTGIFNPSVIIPTEDLDLNILKMVFTHELMHYKRKDLWIKVISFTALILQWFNPVIYIVNKELNKECELSCDWQITKTMDSDEKKYYGLAIINIVDNSISRKMTLGAGMAASSKEQLKERLFMIKKGKKSRKSTVLVSLIIAVMLIASVGFVTNALGVNNETGSESNVLEKVTGDRSSDDFAVAVKKDGLWAVNLSKQGNEIIIDKGGVFKNPKISPDGQKVAYTKDEGLYVYQIDLKQEEKTAVKASEKVISYAWGNSDDLVYCTEKGGLSGFNFKAGKSTAYIESEDRYEGLVGDGHGNVYGQLNRYYTKDGYKYVESKGLIKYELASGKSKLIIPSKPSNEDVKSMEDLGLVPTVAGISKDGAYIYIWCRVHAGSANVDGVPFGVYDVKNDKFTAFSKDQAFALPNKNSLALNPVDGALPLLNSGGNRFMNTNKTLGIVDIKTGGLTKILPKEMISTSDDPYMGNGKGMVTMTPAFSPDGRKVVFSASNTIPFSSTGANDEVIRWLKEPHNIYAVDLSSKKVEKITKGNTFDFAPTYISKGKEIVFARGTDEDTISLWKIHGDSEECIAKGICSYSGNQLLEESLNMYIAE